MKKIAVVTFNLGGPDSLDAVRPFLFNLFNDPAIIRAPGPIRTLIAKLISTRRAPIAREIYAKLGGASPIVPNTRAQTQALEQELNARGDALYKVFIVMRYWHPFADETAREVKNFAPDEIIALPLYPQFSTTTTASSLKDWVRAERAVGLSAPRRAIMDYPTLPGFIEALAQSIRSAYDQAAAFGKPKLLLSAHGLPEKIVKAGDPYPTHCEETAKAIIAALAIENLDATLCYQSRVGPLRWIGPATDAEIIRAAHEKRPIVIAPIAFVSDHSETLVEIDMEYRALAKEEGAPAFFFVPAVGCAPVFIRSLAELVRKS